MLVKGAPCWLGCSIQPTFKNAAGGYSLTDPLPRVHNEQPQWVKQTSSRCARKYSMLISFNIRYTITYPSVTCRYFKFHYENVISHLVIHNEIMQFSRNLRPSNIQIFYINTSPKHPTEPQCRKRETISPLFREAIDQFVSNLVGSNLGVPWPLRA